MANETIEDRVKADGTLLCTIDEANISLEYDSEAEARDAISKVGIMPYKIVDGNELYLVPEIRLLKKLNSRNQLVVNLKDSLRKANEELSENYLPDNGEGEDSRNPYEGKDEYEIHQDLIDQIHNLEDELHDYEALQERNEILEARCKALRVKCIKTIATTVLDLRAQVETLEAEVAQYKD